MTDATRTQVAKPPRRLSAAAVVVWTGLALGTFLAAEALTHGVMLPWFGGFADAIITFILILVACAVLADLTRRHHRAAARHGWRHGKRGAIATARGTRKHGGRGVSFAVRHGKRGASAAYRGARRHGGRGAAFAATQARSRWASGVAQWRKVPANDRPSLSGEWGVPAATAEPLTRRLDGKPETDADKRFFDLRASGYAGPIDQDGNIADLNSTGGTTMTGNGSKQPAVRARRTATSGAVPAEWNGVVAGTADFQAESDGDLLNWMSGQVAGVAAWAEALVEQHETCRDAIGIDPVAIATLHDVADAAVHAAETMAAARKRFADHYELPTEFVANGGLLAHDGRWHKGDAD